MKKPLFSCVIPVKGARPYFDEALESLLSQGMGDDLEIIVQDADVEADLGQSDALNKGFKKAKGEWLFWLNADDVLLPGVLEKVRDFMNRVERVERVEWIAGDMVLIDGEGKVIRCQKDRGSFRAYEGKPIRVFGPSSFFRRELFERVGGLDVNLRYCMDTDLWCRFREAGAWFKKTGSYVWGFREHDGSTTTGAKKPGEQSRQDREVAAMHERRGVKMTAGGVRALRLRRLLDGSFIKAIFDTIRFKGKKWSEIK
jgi:glycosyltransferase involved in cell wall biosynthesis